MLATLYICTNVRTYINKNIMLKISRQLNCLFFYMQGVTFCVYHYKLPRNNALLHILLQTRHCKHAQNRKI